jgi:hypothetical protein
MRHRQAAWRMKIAPLIVMVGGLSWCMDDARSQSANEPASCLARVAVDTRAAADDEIPRQVARALQEDAAGNDSVIQALRARGQDSVQFLMNQQDLRKSPRWSALLDAVAQQKDARYSGLYWHTNLEAALAVAKRENKPVLSLRLLGKLTDELSCANSRFFRTTLYPNPAVRDLLTKNFVLHWQSVRAVPIITIDFGDGRQIRRTITGNSLHLLLDNRGRPVDVLPGLYSAEMFTRELQQSGPAAVELALLDGEDFLRQRTAHHEQRLQALEADWTGLVKKAIPAVNLSMGVDHPPEIWSSLALCSASDPILAGDATKAVVERAPPAAEVAGRMAMTKSIAETPTMRLIRNVSRVINEDSVRNVYYLHVCIHRWFATERPEAEPFVAQSEALVGRVYAELFLSPLNDPWYGLSRPDVFSAIENDGRHNQAGGHDQIGSQNAVTQNAGD